VLIARVFQVVKSFRFTNVEGVRDFDRVISVRNVSRNSARVLKLFVVFFFEMRLKCFPSSKCEPRSFAKCLQNLLIEKSVERL
jgi:hypothetical protein